MLPFIEFLWLKIPTYGLLMAVALFAAAGLTLWRVKKSTSLVVEDVIVVIAVAFGSGILCGSLLYIFITYSLSEIWFFITTLNFKALFGGGLVFYGGLIGGIIGALVSARLLKLDLSLLEHCAVPFVPLAHAIGRIGCLMAGCCYGSVYDGPFAVSYPNAITGVSNHLTYFPVQAVEALLDIVIMIILLVLTKKLHRKLDLLSSYVAMYAVMRFVTEYMRGDAIRGSFLVFSTSQWISVFLLALCIARLIFLKIKEKAVK